MKPLSRLDADTARGLRGVLFDLDDTLLSHGTLTREAYVALWSLRDAGLRLVAVTGRPSGWGEVLVRQWPIDGAVTENGAVQIAREGETGGVAVRERCDETERRSRRLRLAGLAEGVRSIVPEARLADDVSARRSDITWDIGERVRLPVGRVRLIADAIARAGARSTQSSVHLHATFDLDDKASGTVDFLCRVFAEDAGAARVRYAFVGDSGNDAACFAAFHTTFGVSNVRAYLTRIAVVPRFVSTQPMGAGFAEIARALLAARS
jgi:hydroxymethylpyrimidine pyrophosphatase-like HAD family hydrolase